jgi:hypothetical protein
MKKKLNPDEKAYRQSWREVQYTGPRKPFVHHLTKQERIAIAEFKKAQKEEVA